MPLNDSQYRLLNFVEQEFAITAKVPTIDECAVATLLPDAYCEQQFANTEFQQALINRGIIPKPGAQNTDRVLTTKQLAAVATILDSKDTRSDKKKLADLEVPTQTWNAWLKDPVFKAHYYARAQQMYGEALSEAPRALYDNVVRGDLGSIKYLHEMTGFYSEKSKADVDIAAVMRMVIDIITSEVTDPVVLERLAERLTDVLNGVTAGPGLASAGMRVVEGTRTPPRELTSFSGPMLNDL